jgi:hypothetical protein
MTQWKCDVHPFHAMLRTMRSMSDEVMFQTFTFCSVVKSDNEHLEIVFWSIVLVFADNATSSSRCG